MAVSKVTSLLGTRGLDSCNRILVYNSSTFTKKNITDNLGMSEAEAELLAKDPENDTVDNMYITLRRYNVFQPLLPNITEEGLLFIFNNSRLSTITGEGFNTIIFLMDEEILGYTVFLSPIGYNTNNLSATTYSVKRNYIVNNIIIEVLSGGNSIRVDEDTINLLNEIDRGEKRDYTDFFTTKENILGLSRDFGNYNTHLKSLIHKGVEKDIFSDSTYVKMKEAGAVLSKLNFLKDIQLLSSYTDLQYTQVGYYKGDIVLYLWNDNCDYVIISLTKTLSNFFVGSKDPFPYTTPKRDKDGNIISRSEKYHVPNLFKDKTQRISYFAGKYIIVTIDDLDYVFDFERQKGEIELEEPLGAKNPGWVIESYNNLSTSKDYQWDKDKGWIDCKTASGPTYDSLDLVPEEKRTPGYIVTIPDKEPIFLNSFTVNTQDLRSKLVKISDGTWQTWEDAVAEIPFFSESYANVEALIMAESTLTRRIGTWSVFRNDADSTWIYTSPTKSVKIGQEEEMPIILNDQCLLTYTINGDNITYTLYNEPGYFITPVAAGRVYSWTTSNNISMAAPENRNHGYTVYSGLYNKLTIRVNSDDYTKSSSPLVLQNSILSPFRRSKLPTTLEGFKIIGAIGGIIFYRINNTINYL